jgi:PAS domain S-box-containing protein
LRAYRRAELTGAAFVAVIAFAELSPAIPHHPAPKLGWWMGGLVLTLLAALVSVAARHRRRARWLRYVPLVLFMAAVQMLRAADGDGSAGFSPLLILPAIWYALYGTRTGVYLALAGVAAVQFGPLVVVGAPQYPVTLWRAGVLWVVILGLCGVIAHRLVAAIHRKSAALALSEARFRTAFSDAPTGVALIGATGAQLGVFLQVNRALAALLGRSEDEIVNRSVLEFTLPEDRMLTEQHLLAPAERQIAQSIEKRYLHSSGRALPVRITYSRIQAGPDADPCVVAHVEDVGRLRASQLEMLTALEQEQQTSARRRLVAIVSELLTVSPLEEPLPEPEPDPVDIDALVRAAIECIRPIAQNHKLALQVDVRLTGARVSGEADKLDRVLMNLLDNAVKFTPPGGAIDAQARVSGDTVVIDVTDTGIGIDIEEQDRIFDQFFRARKATEQAIAGTGLGLAIARAITEQHHGTIWVCSEPGAGSTFTLTLPLSKADALVAASRRVVSI